MDTLATGRFSIEQLGDPQYPSPLERAVEFSFVRDQDRIAMSPMVGKTHPLSLGSGTASPILDDESFEIAGPRPKIFFNPPRCKAAIVTCGGLCPGINAVVRSLVLLLWYRYNCRQVLGIRYGYNGLSDEAEPPIELNPEVVSNIHHEGGTLLGSSRGAPSVVTMVDYLEKNNINQLFTIGGDGTMRGASLLWEEIKLRGLKIAVVSLPKTIDNDIPFVRRSFGFESAVAAATTAIHSAHVEATGVPHGIGLVKLMGRHAGYIAATACLATGHANLCLIPEIPFDLDGENGVLAYLENRVNQRRHAVVVVAEGAGQRYVAQAAGQKDASGNAKLGDIGLFLRDRINAHFTQKKMDVTLKYIDPSYMIRSAAAHPSDQLHCARLAQNAVHAAMAGKSGLLIGYWHGLMTHVPTKALNGINQRINPKGELWFNVLEMTGQPTHLTGA